MTDPLDRIIEEEIISEDKQGSRNRSIVHLADSFEELQTDDFGFNEEDIGKFYSGLVMQARNYWLSKTEQEFIDNEYDSRGVRKTFQDNIRDSVVLYALQMMTSGKDKEEIIDELNPDRIKALDVEEANLKPGTIEYELVQSINKGKSFEDIGVAVLEGSTEYIKHVKPGKVKQSLFIEYRTIHHALKNLNSD